MDENLRNRFKNLIALLIKSIFTYFWVGKLVVLK